MLQLLPKIEPAKVRAELCRRSFYFFVQQFWGAIIAEEPVWNWHIEYLCNELQQIGERVKARAAKEYDLIINIPPGTSKSTIVSQMFPAWLWTIDPSLRTICSSHSKTLSIDLAEKSRAIIISDKYRAYFPEIKIMRTTEAKSHFKNNHNGERYATSVGESRIGIHAHVIIVDDPLNPKEATSEADRLTANKHITQTLSTRKVDKKLTVTILIMQRLHENDPTGHLLNRKGDSIKHICLPAEISEAVKPTVLQARYIDGLLDPIRMSRAVLNEAKTDLGSYGYAGQFKQKPADEAGGIIKRTWFGRYTLSQLLSRSEQLKQPIVPCYWVDGAYTDDESSNDPNAILCGCILGNMLYVLEVIQVWAEFPDLIAFIKKFVARHGCEAGTRVYIEPKASGKSIVQQLKRETVLNIIEDDAPRDSKVTRVRAISPVIEAGRVLLPEEAMWVESFVDECVTFPKAAHDDRVDCLEAACRRLSGKGHRKAIHVHSK